MIFIIEFNYFRSPIFQPNIIQKANLICWRPVLSGAAEADGNSAEGGLGVIRS
jgi:hypothetical protein